MRIKWIGQSGYIIDTGTNEIAIDPYLSDSVNRVAGRPRMLPVPVKPEDIKANAIICTHNHLDHLDPDSVSAMDENLHFITTAEGKNELDSLGRHNVTVLEPGKSITLGDVCITAVFAKHTVEAFGVILKSCGYTLYFSGDTLFDPKLFEISDFNPDIAFICINGKLGNMDVNQAVTVAKKIGAEINVPNHYGMFLSNTEDPAKFTGRLTNAFETEFNRWYEVGEILTEK